MDSNHSDTNDAAFQFMSITIQEFTVQLPQYIVMLPLEIQQNKMEQTTQIRQAYAEFQFY